MNARIKKIRIPVLDTVNPKVTFFVLAGILVFVFGIYAYLVNKTIMNVVARENTEKTISELSTTIGELELDYMTKRNAITLELAHAKGFKEATPTKFISRTPSVISYNSQ